MESPGGLLVYRVRAGRTTTPRGAPIEPREQDRSTGDGSTAILFTIAGVLAAYFGIFGLLWLDEMVLKKSFIWRHLPHAGQEVVKLIYKPLILLVSP